MPLKVVITGFGRFPGAAFNPSGPLAERLTRRRRPALAEVARLPFVFATSYAAVDRDLPKLLALRPDIVLMFGLAGRTPHLRIETRARNARSVLLPDASGHLAPTGVIARGAPPARRGRAPFASLLHAARVVPARLSRDAGRYLCNYAYWRALEATANSRTLVQFVHIPLVRRNPLPHARAKQRRLSLAALARAGEAILVALVAARRR
jgi:pyroglutamyl-peptidase